MKCVKCQKRNKVIEAILYVEGNNLNELKKSFERQKQEYLKLKGLKKKPHDTCEIMYKLVAIATEIKYTAHLIKTLRRLK